MPKDNKKTMTFARDDKKVIFLTKEGLEQLKTELDYLENVKRKEVAARIKEAVSYGDLSENSEYEEAKNDQAFVEGRILQLNEQIKYAKVIDEDVAHHQTRVQISVQLGNMVTIKVLSGKNANQKHTYTIVGSTEANPVSGKISNVSPVGMALLDGKVGEKVKINAPSGEINYQILAIE